MAAAVGIKVRLVKWGNSQAIRIPKPILDRVRIMEGDQLAVSVEGGTIALRKTTPALTLEALVSKITDQNRHSEQDWGKSMGKEVW
jgi:antitoxin MazE